LENSRFQPNAAKPYKNKAEKTRRRKLSLAAFGGKTRVAERFATLKNDKGGHPLTIDIPRDSGEFRAVVDGLRQERK
jgi:hypothetical protein